MIRYWLALAGLIGVFALGYRTGSHHVQAAWNVERLSQAQALLAGQAKAAADLKAAQKAADAAVAAVTAQKGEADAKFMDAERRIAALRLRLDKIPTSAVPETGDHQPSPTGTASSAGLLADGANALAGCARDYSDVTGKLEAIGRLR